MPNCDWNKPCDCVRCTTREGDVVCTQCGFQNAVVVRGSAAYVVDRKGIGGYDVSFSEGLATQLTCFKCGFVNQNAPSDSKVDEVACKARLVRDEVAKTAEPCGGCARKIHLDVVDGWQAIRLTECDGLRLCETCLRERAKLKAVDPSTSTAKYEWSEHAGSFVLVKVKKPCEECGRQRWLSADNAWQRKCGTCFKKARA